MLSPGRQSPLLVASRSSLPSIFFPRYGDSNPGFWTEN